MHGLNSSSKGSTKRNDEEVKQWVDRILGGSECVIDDPYFREDNPNMTIKQHALESVDGFIEDAILTGQVEWKQLLKKVRKHIEKLPE